MRRTLVVLAALAVLVSGCGGSAELGVADAWARPAVGPNGAVYLTIDGDSTDTALIAASAPSDVAAAVELHQTVLRDNGVAAMTQITRLDIPAESTVMMVPGGLHVMLIDLAKPLELGDAFDLTLMFDDGTSLIAAVEVRDA